MKIKKLSNKKAAALGAEIIAESLLTMIPVSFVIIALKRKYDEDAQMEEIETNIEELTDKYNNLNELLNEMRSELVQLEDQMVERQIEIRNMQYLSEQFGNDLVASAHLTSLEKQQTFNIVNDLDTDDQSCDDRNVDIVQ